MEWRASGNWRISRGIHNECVDVRLDVDGKEIKLYGRSVSGLEPGRRTWVGVNNSHVKTDTDEGNHLLCDDR